MSAKKVLVVDDEASIREMLRLALEISDFECLEAADIHEAYRLITDESPDMVLLDWMLPGGSGIELLRRLKKEEATQALPVIMLTARGEDTDRIVGLELGADDYLAKPFNPRELVARIEAVLRRTEVTTAPGTLLRAGPLVVDEDRRVVTLGGAAIDLTTTEFEILRVLVANAGRVIARERLMELARGEEYAAFDRSVDVHVSHIRKKLGEDTKDPVFVKTVRGVGYTMPRDPR